MIVNGEWVKVGNKIECPRCKKLRRWHSTVLYKGVRYCTPCYKFLSVQIGTGSGTAAIPLEEAEQKVRDVRHYVSLDGYTRICNISLPTCYIGKRVRVIVVEDEDGC